MLDWFHNIGQKKRETQTPQVTNDDIITLEKELVPYLSYPQPKIPRAGVSIRNTSAPQYELIEQSVIGQRHVDEGMEKEDNYLTWSDKEKGVFVFALGDGHGDSNCFRSKTGSEFVSRIAVEKLKEFERGIGENNYESFLRSPSYREQVIRHLIISIKYSWDNAVNENLQNVPISESEWNQCDGYLETYKSGNSLEHIFGTTLIAGLATRDYLLLLQQGDGRCDVFHADGTVDQPIPWDDDCVGNATTSMCQPDAWERCRYHFINLHEDPIVACLAGSDGVEDSVSTMDEVHSIYRNMLLYAIDKSVDELNFQLENSLTNLNKNGSRDDTTVVGIIDCAAVKLFEKQYRRDNKATSLITEWKRADETIRSKEMKKEHLRQKYENSRAQYDSIKVNSKAIFEYHSMEVLKNKIDIIRSCVSNEEYVAVVSVIENWMKDHSQLAGLWEKISGLEKAVADSETEYKEYLEKYVEQQRIKARVAKEFAELYAGDKSV